MLDIETTWWYAAGAMAVDTLAILARACERIRVAEDAKAVESATEEARREIAALPASAAAVAQREVAGTSASALERIRLRDQALEAVRAREVLLAGISHDLRNPLNTFAMSTGLLRDDLERGDIDVQRGLGLVTRMERGIERMQRLIEDLHEASRIEAKKVSLARKPEDAGVIVEDVIAQTSAQVKERGASVLKGEVGGGKVDADRARIVQALTKLVSYAARSTGEGGVIRVSASTDLDARVAFSVVAGGAGGSHIMQLDDLKGGLSLLIARGIVEAHGSSLSVAGGETLTLGFTLPAAT